MSRAFDLAQYAINHLLGSDPTSQDEDVAYFLCELVSKWHDYSHAHDDYLNRGVLVGNTPDLLRTALRYRDDDERKMWLDIRRAA